MWVTELREHPDIQSEEEDEEAAKCGLDLCGSESVSDRAASEDRSCAVLHPGGGGREGNVTTCWWRRLSTLVSPNYPSKCCGYTQPVVWSLTVTCGCFCPLLLNLLLPFFLLLCLSCFLTLSVIFLSATREKWNHFIPYLRTTKRCMLWEYWWCFEFNF